MSQTVLTRQTSVADALAKVQDAFQNPGEKVPIPHPSSDINELKVDGDSVTLSSFTTEDAIVLGNLLLARLMPYAKDEPSIISIAHANSHIVFQTATGPGTVLENESWVRRKRNTITRFGRSSWYMQCMFQGDSEKFFNLFAIGPEKRIEYAIAGGGVPIRIKGFEGVAASVVVSGLKQEEDHGVIMDVIKSNWK
ncbi:hypothetical protein EDB81DRAFT_864393 [Dactylonectria macrodidyma]|uniref:DUF967 domain protein n=1 Tax=Dactylonectria macrodidyma TaxID=307937 RepID=A0A9P9FW22_9HYPO|nr:hypothetical protein EDB81DRAFT_864393 [Dactylonectria macrodidyma]